MPPVAPQRYISCSENFHAGSSDASTKGRHIKVAPYSRKAFRLKSSKKMKMPLAAAIEARKTSSSPSAPSSPKDLKDASPSPRPTASKRQEQQPQIPLPPRFLPRPPVQCEVRSEQLRAIHPDLTSVHPRFVRQSVERRGAELLEALVTVKASPDKRNLPDSIAVTFEAKERTAPTHMLAIFEPAPSTSQRPSAETTPSDSAPVLPSRKVVLYPVHSLVLAAHCACLPIAPPSPFHSETGPRGQKISPDTPVDLPVWRIVLPAPELFPILSVYLYNKNLPNLFKAMLPAEVPEHFYSKPGTTACPTPLEIQACAEDLGQKFGQQDLLRCLGRVTGIHRNAYALGVCDEGLWMALGIAYESLLIAFHTACSRTASSA